jgi:hypothetical protein
VGIKRRMMRAAVVAAAMFAVVILIGRNEDSRQSELAKSGQIFLYGEAHGVEVILADELRLWEKYYHEDGMRHLFIEFAYYDSEILNMWMQEGNDNILDEWFEGLRGTAAYTESVKDFFRQIKKSCPKTIFHGTDVGHQYNTTGRRYLEYLELQGKEDTEEYRLAEEAAEQGRYYKENSDDEYREGKMAENFIREFDKLDGLSVMGIYGGAHTAIGGTVYGTQSVPCMANQLHGRYGGTVVKSKDLSRSFLGTDIAGKNYRVLYWATFANGAEYVYRYFIWVKDAYDDFKDNKPSGKIIYEDNFPDEVREGNIYIVVDKYEDATSEKFYYRAVKEADKVIMEGFLVTG